MSEDKVQLEIGIVIRVDKSDDQGATFTVFNGKEPTSMYLAKGQAAKSGITLILPEKEVNTVTAAIHQAVKVNDLKVEVMAEITDLAFNVAENPHYDIAESVNSIMKLVWPDCED